MRNFRPHTFQKYTTDPPISQESPTKKRRLCRLFLCTSIKNKPHIPLWTGAMNVTAAASSATAIPHRPYAFA